MAAAQGGSVTFLYIHSPHEEGERRSGAAGQGQGVHGGTAKCPVQDILLSYAASCELAAGVALHQPTTGVCDAAIKRVHAMLA